MICKIVIFRKCYKPRRLQKTNQEQTENYCKRWKIITERIEVRIIKKLSCNHGLLNTRSYMSHLKAKIKRPVSQKKAIK